MNKTMLVRRPLALAAAVMGLCMLLLCSLTDFGRDPAREERLRKAYPNRGEASFSGRVVGKSLRRESLQFLLLPEDPLFDGHRILCECKSGGQEPAIGQSICVTGRTSHFEGATNPGEFDARSYYQILRISMKCQDISYVENRPKSFDLRENLYQIKQAAARALERIFSEEDAGILCAMLLGERSGLAQEQKQLYQMGGIMHVIAISGLHIALLGMGVYRLLRRLPIPLCVAALLAGALICLYGMMCATGGTMSGSGLRAMGMFLLQMLAPPAGRTYDAKTALSVVGIGLLLEQPLYITQCGFLLSFLAVIGVFVCKPALEKSLGIEPHRYGPASGRPASGRPASDSPASGCSAFVCLAKLRAAAESGFLMGSSIALTTLPVVLYFYFQYPVYSMLWNLYVIPLMGILLGGALLSLGVGLYSLRFAKMTGLSSRAILWLYDLSCRAGLLLPGGIWVTGRPELWKIAVYYFSLSVVLAGTSCGKLARVTCKLLIPFLLLLLCRPTHDGLRIRMLDVGQGLCVVMETAEGDCFVFDAGSTSRKAVETYQIVPALKADGVGKIKGLFLSHGDEDHVSGARAMLENAAMLGIEIGEVYLPDVAPERKKEQFDSLEDLALQAGAKVRYLHRGMALQMPQPLTGTSLQMPGPLPGMSLQMPQPLPGMSTGRSDSLQLRCLSPAQGFDSQEANEMSLALLVEYGDFQMLLTGDITGEAEQEMCREFAKLREQYRTQGRNLSLEVLQVAHHGSRYSTGEDVLAVLQPEHALISAGAGNRYKHPHAELLARLTGQGSTIWQTPRTGAITLETDGNDTCTLFCVKK